LLLFCARSKEIEGTTDGGRVVLGLFGDTGGLLLRVLLGSGEEEDKKTYVSNTSTLLFVIMNKKIK